MAADPTYPLYPITCILSTAMLLLVLLTSFIRQNWNLGVAFLCFWLFIENLTDGINAIIWADNADIKLYVYCDIVSRTQMITFVVKPMATLIITRRLYLITSLQSVELPDKAAVQCSKRRDVAIEWTLGLVIPVLVAGPIYYIIQQLRFQVEEGFGCENAPDGSVLNILLINSWTVVPPLISVTLYYPKVARIFYRQSRDINQFLQSNNSVTRTNYIRILVLASIDVILTLPIGIVSIVLGVTSPLSAGVGLPAYRGWTYDHTDWEPEGFSYESIVAQGTLNLAQNYFLQWTSPVLAFAIFGLFGITAEARASYWRLICTVCGWFGWKPKPHTRRAPSPLGDHAGLGDQEMDLEIGSNPSYINPDARVREQEERISSEGDRAAAESDMEITETLKEAIDDTTQSSGNAARHESASAGSVRAAYIV